MRDKTPRNAEDLRLWHRAIADVRPLPGRKPPEARAEITALAPEIRPSESQASRHPGLEGTLRQRLRRGRIEIEDRLDLHGLRQKEAHGALDAFLSQAQTRGARLLLVITGKGRGLDSTLRRLVPLWLAEGANRTRVAYFSEAAPQHGGAGALYVYLARRTKR